MSGREAVAVVAATVLLVGCGGEPARSDDRDAGPLELHVALVEGCRVEQSLHLEIEAAQAVNVSELPLTLDQVTLTGARNVALAGATLKPEGDPAVPAVDATIPEQTGQALTLELDIHERPASFRGVSVDYHNVEGRFRARVETPLEIVTRCGP